MKPRRSRQVSQSKIYDSKAHTVIFVVSARLRNKCKRLFISWRKRSRSLQRRQAGLRLLISDVGLRQQIFYVRTLVPAAAETIQKLDRRFELAGPYVAKREIEIRRVFVCASSTRGQQVRDGFTEKAFASERGSGLEFAIGILLRGRLALLYCGRLVLAGWDLRPSRNLGADTYPLRQDDRNRNGDCYASPPRYNGPRLVALTRATLLAENVRYFHFP
jgi:hypothetical protein